ncbi:MAG: serine hydrolase domain-containing protein [Xanthobacteraceae bacterium]
MLRLILSTVAGFLISTGVASAFSWNSMKERQAQQLVKQFQVLHQVPSVAVSITVDGNPVLATSFDTDGSIVPRGEDVRYHIGSVSKQFTAAAVLALIEERTIVPSTNLPITLDTSLSELFPNLDRMSDSGKVTVRRLLTMNLPSYTDDTLAHSISPSGVVPASQPIDANAIIQRLKSYNQVGPALTFGYSNTNYFVLALIIDALKGNYQLTKTLPPLKNMSTVVFLRRPE